MAARAELSEATKARLIEKIEHSDFESADELIARALDALETAEKSARLDAALERSLAQIARGEYIEYTEEWEEESYQEIVRAYERGERADPRYAYLFELE